MVWAFCVGLFVGLPVGCYLREVGYSRKAKDAWAVLFPDNGNVQMDRFRNNGVEFSEKLKKGEAQVQDFERYIYGGTKNLKNLDERDREEEKERQKILKDIRSM